MRPSLTHLLGTSHDLRGERVASLLGLVSMGLAIPVGCTCESNLESDRPPNPEMVWACRPTEANQVLTVRAAGEPSAGTEPAAFAVELGRPHASGDRLFLPYLDHDGRKQHARLLLASSALEGSRILDLGEVHGDASPPQVTSSGDALYVAVSESDARGESYRVARIAAVGGEPDWLLETPGGGDRSPAFDIASIDDTALLVFDDWDSTEGRGVIRGTHTVARTRAPVVKYSPDGVDVEGPRLVARKDVYWVAWVALGDPVAEPTPDEPAELSVESVRVSRRWIQVRRVGKDGAPLGEVLDVTPQDGFVVGFDIVAGHDDSVLLAIRDGRSTPGIAGGTIRTATVTASGAVELRDVADQDVGTGLPSLAFDSDPKDGAPHGWLAYTEANGDTRLVALAPTGASLDLSGAVLDLEEDSLLVAHGGLLTVGHPRGRDVELLLKRCSPAPKNEAPPLQSGDPVE